MTDAPRAFQLQSSYQPAGDQPEAIARLIDGLQNGLAHQTLLGVTGSGKTFTIANVIQHVQRPTLVMAHNKTLAAQLYGEFKEFFPDNAVEYFVSYYDYYQPEAYVPSSTRSSRRTPRSTSTSNRCGFGHQGAARAARRHHRRDACPRSTASAIPQAYLSMVLHLVRGDARPAQAAAPAHRHAVHTQRAGADAGTYRVRGDVIDIFPAESEREAVRIELFDDDIEALASFDPLTGESVKIGSPFIHRLIT